MHTTAINQFEFSSYHFRRYTKKFRNVNIHTLNEENINVYFKNITVNIYQLYKK